MVCGSAGWILNKGNDAYGRVNINLAEAIMKYYT